jgi:diketogulonate reductase-like aldo/keto reductase
MRELLAAGGERCATNQILYNLARRGVEFDLLPSMAERHMPAMAYSPIEQGRLPALGVLATLASEHGVCAPQIALAWLLRRKDLLVIPKASSIEHLRQNHQALAIALSPEDLRAIDREFPSPRRKTPLEML